MNPRPFPDSTTVATTPDSEIVRNEWLIDRAVNRILCGLNDAFWYGATPDEVRDWSDRSACLAARLVDADWNVQSGARRDRDRYERITEAWRDTLGADPEIDGVRRDAPDAQHRRPGWTSARPDVGRLVDHLPQPEGRPVPIVLDRWEWSIGRRLGRVFDGVVEAFQYGSNQDEVSAVVAFGLWVGAGRVAADEVTQARATAAWNGYVDFWGERCRYGGFASGGRHGAKLASG
jgi:hypothetical protein